MGGILDKKPASTKHRRLRAKLIFNPGAGATGESPVQLMDVIRTMQAWKLVPEAYLVEPDSDLPGMVKNALQDGIRMFVVCGGDGTVDSVAGALVGTGATLGIIPTGTQNNVALSLDIPTDIPGAIALLREGQRLKVDIGLVAGGETEQPFLEICTVGLWSALYPMADDIQHGNLRRVGDFLATLLASPPSEIHLRLDGEQKIHAECHGVVVTNMPYIGPNFQAGTSASMKDGLLDVLLFAELSKLDLLGDAVQVAISSLEDSRILHYQARKIEINSNPAMPVMVDGVPFREGPLRIRVRRHHLAVMAGRLAA